MNFEVWVNKFQSCKELVEENLEQKTQDLSLDANSDEISYYDAASNYLKRYPEAENCVKTYSESLYHMGRIYD